MTKTDPRLRKLIPEVIQTSTIDCGPASLTALLRGLKCSVDYDRVRDACQTAVDGTSIDAIEDLARALGFDAEQIILPTHQLFDPLFNVLPAIVVIRLSTGWPHFVVVWRRHGRFLQVMDPSVGRRFVSVAKFQEELFVYRLLVPANAYEDHLKSDSVITRLQARIARLGLAASGRVWCQRAINVPGWEGLARLDAAISQAEAELNETRWCLRPRLIKSETIAFRVREDGPSIPGRFFAARSVSDAFVSNSDSGPMLAITGAIAVKIRHNAAKTDGKAHSASSSTPGLGRELQAILTTRTKNPIRIALDIVLADGWMTLAGAASGLVIAGASFLVEALIFSRAWRLIPQSPALGQLFLLLGILAGVAVIEGPATATIWGVGRRMEIRLRERLSEKISHIHHHYLQTRPTSDLISRIHLIHRARLLPQLGGRSLRTLAAMGAIIGGIAWLAPSAAPLAALAVLTTMILPLGLVGPLRERDFRRRVQDGALSRFILDSLLGIVPLKSHVGNPALRSEHEEVLAAWRESSSAFSRASTSAEVVQLITGYTFSAWLVLAFLPTERAHALLFVYLALSIPAWGRAFTLILRELPQDLNIVRRITEPLASLDDPAWTPLPAATSDAMMSEPMSPRSPEMPSTELANVTRPSPPSDSTGVQIVFSGIHATLGGHPVLDSFNLKVSAGEHLAIVGPSGAGKSTVIAMLLGVLQPISGELLVDGAPLKGSALTQLRKNTAWVDPSVTLWNRSLKSNILYGFDSENTFDQEGLTHSLVARAQLTNLIHDLPLGLDTVLGESGALLSGGEGQRVRFARALGRSSARLILLDEPFAGIDRPTRQILLSEARTSWANATLIYITHDLEEAHNFPRVIVMEHGMVVQDGSPQSLWVQVPSRYAELRNAETKARDALKRRPWKRLSLDQRHTKVDKLSVTNTPSGTECDTLSPDISSTVPRLPNNVVRRSAKWGGPIRAIWSDLFPCRRTRPRSPSSDDQPKAPLQTKRTAPLGLLYRSDYPLGIAMIVSHASVYITYLCVWALAGSVALHINFMANERVLWLTLLGILIATQAVATRLAGAVSIRVGSRLKRRLLEGTFNLSPDVVRHSGIGMYLGIIFEAETLQTLTFSGGYGGMLGIFELVSTALVFVISDLPQVLLVLAGWCMLTFFFALRYRIRLLEWTHQRFTLTSEQTERLIGHQTRLVQGPSPTQEDGVHLQHLAQYRDTSRRLDHLTTVLSSLLPQGWLALGGATVFLGAGSSSSTSLAIALAGLLLGWQAFSSLSTSATQTAQAWASWRQLRPLLSASQSQATTLGQTPVKRCDEPSEVLESDEGLILEARSLTFHHQGRQENVLKGVSVALAVRDRLVIEGPSGSGKSTLLGILARLREAPTGSLNASGMDATVVSPDQWRHHIVLVPQAHENHLFGASLAFNLLLGNPWPPKKEDLQNISTVLEDLGLKDLLLKMPSGPGQIVGETGWQLSQGERSRLWLARALLQKPDVLLLDEGLGTLDPELRLDIITYLERFPGAVVVASHE